MSGEPGAVPPFERMRLLHPDEQSEIVESLPGPHKRELLTRWEVWAHHGQRAPEGDWRIWLIRAGRGFGKTRAGAEWVSAVARANPDARIALVGATIADAHRVMIDGASGLRSVAWEEERVVWRGTKGEFVFPSGARAFVYSAEAPDALRGPEHHAAWCDELAKWRCGDVAWDNLMMGLRLGEGRVVVTTTPRPVPLMRRLLAMPGLVETVGRTVDNPHLPVSFVAAMAAQYGATRLGRQELGGEMIEDAVGALWTRAMIEACRTGSSPDPVRVVVGVDPPAGIGGDACGIVAVALDAGGIGYVLEDASVVGASPEGWARAVAACVERHGADRVIAEVNQGGAMVESVLRGAAADLPIKTVHATRGKVLRAEPVAALYERGKVRHVGAFPALEDELCGLVSGGGYEGPGRSPDRADALVWAVTALMLGAGGSPKVRVVG